MKLIELNICRIFELCRIHKVKTLAVFGSIVTDRFCDSSDVDLSVTFDEESIDDPFLNFFDFVEALEELFGRKVDLVDETAIVNPFFKKELELTKRPIYGYQDKRLA